MDIEHWRPPTYAGRVVGPNGNGVVAVGTRTLSESGTVGSWQREQVRLAM
jgi:hypothetical protein